MASQRSEATKLPALKLPSASSADGYKPYSDTDDSETIVPPTATRFSRRHDYRQDDKDKKQADDKAKKDAVDNAQKAQQQQLNAYKQQEQTAIDANNQAVALGKQGHWEEAITSHEKAVQYDPRNKQFQINLSAARTTYGQERLAKGDLTTASNLFRKALAAAPDNGLAGKQLVQCLKKMGHNPNSADVRMTLGDQLAASGDLQGAAVEYTAAMQLEPSARTYIKLGDMNYRYGQIGGAMNWYRQAIVKDPDCGAAHRQLGLVEMGQHDYTAAAASLRKAVILDTKDVAAGQALVDMWRRQVAANPLLAENHLGLAGSLQLTGDFVGADSEYRKLEALDPKNSGLQTGRASLIRAIQHAKAEKHKLAADTLCNQGLHQDALQEIEQAVTLDPRNAGYQYLLGECLESVGDAQGAHQAYLTCVLIDPENNKEAASRIRLMQEHGTINSAQTNQMTGQLANRMTGQPMQNAPQAMATQVNSTPMQMNSAPMQTVPQQMAQPMQQQPSSNSSSSNSSSDIGYRKNMFEGGKGPGNIPANAQLGFRTHDESIELAAAPPEMQKAAQPVSVPDMPSSPNDALSKVTEAESQRDYNTAISLLHEVSSNNLQNPEIHHRLAVNLLAAGQISEALSEFRIASALSPTKKAYSDDLAQALAINKRSLMTESNSNGVKGAN